MNRLLSSAKATGRSLNPYYAAYVEVCAKLAMEEEERERERGAFGTDIANLKAALATSTQEKVEIEEIAKKLREKIASMGGEYEGVVNERDSLIQKLETRGAELQNLHRAIGIRNDLLSEKDEIVTRIQKQNEEMNSAFISLTNRHQNSTKQTAETVKALKDQLGILRTSLKEKEVSITGLKEEIVAVKERSSLHSRKVGEELFVVHSQLSEWMKKAQQQKKVIRTLQSTKDRMVSRIDQLTIKLKEFEKKDASKSAAVISVSR